MRDFPLLCINPGCRPEDRGGPRRTERAWFCAVCIERTAEKLHAIADAWGDLEQALTRSGGGSSEPTSGTRDVGLELNEKASAARIKTGADVYAFGRMVLDWGDENGRNLAVPEEGTRATIPAVAKWIADWHLSVFTVHAGKLSALAFIEDVWADHRAVRSAAYPRGGWRSKPLMRCEEHGTSAMGERVACEGWMHAWVVPDATSLPDLVCSEDQTHRLDPTTWQRKGWKRAHSMEETA